jgi:hypothetical protein
VSALNKFDQLFSVALFLPFEKKLEACDPLPLAIFGAG